MGKPEGKRLLGRPRRRGEYNITMDLQEVRCGVIDWIDVAQVGGRWRALVNVVMNLVGSIKCGEFLENRLASQKNSAPWS